MSKKETQTQQRRFFTPRKKFCKFCAEDIHYIDYKNIPLLEEFVLDRGKILSRRMTGTCAYHQRRLASAIKKARIMALLPFLPE